MKKRVVLLLICAVLFTTQVLASQEYGPLQATIRFPLHMLVLTPRPVNPQLPPKGAGEATLALEYSNTYFNHSNQQWDAVIDAEVFVAELSAVYSLTERLAVRLDVPMIAMGDGFLDGFLQNYHDLIGVSNYDREDRPKNQFAYRVTKDGRLWVEGESDTFPVGDIRISAQLALPAMSLAGRPLRGSVLATVKTPTGDADAAMGSGQYDVGLFLPLKWTAARWSFYLMPGFVRIDDPQTEGAIVSARNITGLFAGVAYRYNEKWRLLAQINYYSSPFETSGLSELDNGAVQLDLGFQRSLGRSLYLEFAFSEDLTLAVPDFNLRLGLTWQFGSTRPD